MTIPAGSEFLSWLKTLREDEYISPSGSVCPIRRWLEQVVYPNIDHGQDLEVGYEGLGLIEEHNAPPPWAVKFMSWVDSHGWSVTTAGDAINFLEAECSDLLN